MTWINRWPYSQWFNEFQIREKFTEIHTQLKNKIHFDQKICMQQFDGSSFCCYDNITFAMFNKFILIVAVIVICILYSMAGTSACVCVCVHGKCYWKKNGIHTMLLANTIYLLGTFVFKCVGPLIETAPHTTTATTNNEIMHLYLI